MPPALKRKPSLSAAAALYLHAFSLLHERREIIIGNGIALPRSIPLSEIKAYCDLYGIEDKASFTDILTALDRGYLDARSD